MPKKITPQVQASELVGHGPRPKNSSSIKVPAKKRPNPGAALAKNEPVVDRTRISQALVNDDARKTQTEVLLRQVLKTKQSLLKKKLSLADKQSDPKPAQSIKKELNEIKSILESDSPIQAAHQEFLKAGSGLSGDKYGMLSPDLMERLGQSDSKVHTLELKAIYNNPAETIIRIMDYDHPDANSKTQALNRSLGIIFRNDNGPTENFSTFEGLKYLGQLDAKRQLDQFDSSRQSENIRRSEVVKMSFRHFPELNT